MKRLPIECCADRDSPRGYAGGLALILAVSAPFLGRAYFRAPTRPVHRQRAHAQRHTAGSKQRLHRQVENIIRSVVKPKDLGMIVSNIGVYPDLSASTHKRIHGHGLRANEPQRGPQHRQL